MKKIIQVLIVCGLFVVMGGTASGESFSDLEEQWYKSTEQLFSKVKKLAESGDVGAIYAMGEYHFNILVKNCSESEKKLSKECVSGDSASLSIGQAK